MGKMRMLDYAMVDTPIATLFTMVPDWFSPMSPHLGLWGSFSARPRTLTHRVLVAPKEFPFIEMYEQENDRKSNELKAKQIQRATDAVTRRLQNWLETHMPQAEHDNILADPKIDSIPQQHPHLQSYLEILLSYQEARLGVSDDQLDPEPTAPEEQTQEPPPLPLKETEGVPAPSTPPPDWLLPDWYRDEWIPPEQRGPRSRPDQHQYAVHEPPAFQEVMFHPGPWKLAPSEEHEPEPEQEPKHIVYPVPQLLHGSTNDNLLDSFQEVSTAYQRFLQDAEDYHIRAFEISPETAKEYRGRGCPPKYLSLIHI